MKKIVVFVLMTSLLLSFTGAFAETADINRFKDYTDVNLNVFVENGYSCAYDDFQFMAEISPVKSEITHKGENDDTYSIKMDIKVIYSAGECRLVPRLIFSRKGVATYVDDKMSEVYIRNGQNRYIVDVSGCSRSSQSKYYTATDTSVEPMYTTGIIMLKDLALYPMDISVKMGSYSDAIVLTSEDQQAIKTFYEDCLSAGLFEQDFLFIDDYSVRTLFNNNPSDGTETPVEEEMPTDEE